MEFLENVKEYIENDDTYISKWIQLNSVIDIPKRKLQIVPIYFRHFSRHDQSYSEAILKYLELLIGRKQLALLSISDQVLIVLAAYFHDMGMSLEFSDIEKLFQDDSFAL